MTTDPCTLFSPASDRPALPRVVSIAGTDPSGGAGTAADLKSITAAGGFGMAVVTALVAQNTRGVRDIHVPQVEFLAAQLDAVSDDVALDAVKTGMLGTAEVIDTVAAWLDAHPPRVLVVDPVMVASSGDRLLDAAAEQAMIRFCARATVVTPNIEELAVLTGSPCAATEADALDQAARWAADTGVAIVVKTGHLDGRELANTWIGPDGSRHRASSTRVDTRSTHGTGCSLASALATRLGAGHGPAAALAWATEWLHEAVRHGAALQVGSGHGPVDHGHRARRLAAAGSAAPWLTDDAVPARWEHPEQLAGLTLAADGALRAATGADLPTGADAARWDAGGGSADGAQQADADGALPDAAGGSADAPTGREAVRAIVPPVGRWTEALWTAGAPLAGEISRSGFVRALIDGSLPEPQFSFYLAQDAHYLLRYSRALGALAETSTDPVAREFWASSSQECLDVEMELHRDWLAHRPAAGSVPVGPVTSAYTDFLLATALNAPPAVAAAAVLPCFWLYAQVGADVDEVAPDHPYAAWLETYRDPGFVEGVTGALHQVERELEAASPADRAEAARAYLLACRHELEFFEQARRIEAPLPGAPRDQEAALSAAAT